MNGKHKIGWTWNPFTKRFEKLIGEQLHVMYSADPFLPNVDPIKWIMLFREPKDESNIS